MTTVGELLLQQNREREKYEELRECLTFNLQIPPVAQAAAESLLRYQGQIQDQLAPTMAAILELQRVSRLDQFQESLRQLVAAQESWAARFRRSQVRLNEEWIDRTRAMYDELARNIAFPSVAQLAHDAAILRYPWLDLDPSEWPEDLGLDDDIEDDDTGKTGVVRRRWRDALLIASFLGQIVGDGGGIHIHNTTVINLTSPAPARIAPHGRAQEIERLPQGTKILTLDGSDRWCPVWPVGPVRQPQGGWVFRRHVEEVNE